MPQGLIGSRALANTRPLVEAVPLGRQDRDPFNVLDGHGFDGVGNLARLLRGQVGGRRANVSEACSD